MASIWTDDGELYKYNSVGDCHVYRNGDWIKLPKRTPGIISLEIEE
jgi:hypothetical protein